MLRGVDMLETTQDAVEAMPIKPVEHRAADVFALERLLDHAGS